jgi:excisionase family DNA binding protein
MSMNGQTSARRPVTADASERIFLTAAEVGQELGLKKSRVYELAAAGLLPVVRLGRRMLFPRRGLDALVDTAIERAKERLDLNST